SDHRYFYAGSRHRDTRRSVVVVSRRGSAGAHAVVGTDDRGRQELDVPAAVAGDRSRRSAFHARDRHQSHGRWRAGRDRTGEPQLMANAAELLFEVERLRVDIPTAGGTLHAVRDVSFSLNQGEILGIVGESGCGKTLTA